MSAQVFTEAVAAGDLRTVGALMDEGADPSDMHAGDGTTPLCVAALWGNCDMVELLLERCPAAVNAQNLGTLWTALHAAAFQEHGKIVRALLERGADAAAADAAGRTPADFASLSEGVWPFFGARGFARSAKADLVAKGIIRKEENPAEHKRVATMSRPGSAYVRVDDSPFAAAASARSGRASAAAQAMAPFEGDSEDDEDEAGAGAGGERKVSLRGVHG